MMLCCLVVGMGADRLWTASHARTCIVRPAVGAHPPFRCATGSSSSTTIFVQPSGPITSLPGQ